MRLVAGVLILNAVLLAAGYSLLAGSLAGRRLRTWISYAAVAYLVGAGVVVTTTSFAYIAGAPNGLVALVAALVATGALGLFAVRRRLRALAAPPSQASVARSGRLTVTAETAILTTLVIVAGVLVVGGFRSSPWFSDVWAIWVPKGRTLDRIGLDPRVFVPENTYLGFGVPQYPLWWPTLTGLDLRFVGSVDLRSVPAQDTLLFIGFLGAALRLLWGHVRPWLLGASLLLVALAPELARHARGGLADLPLGIYFALCALALYLWLRQGSTFHLLLATLFGITALQIKSEAGPQLVILGVFSLVAARVAHRRLRHLIGAGLAIVLSAAPWEIWLAVHNVHAEDVVSFKNALSVSYLSARTSRIDPTTRSLAHLLVDRHDWPLIVPLAVVLPVAAALWRRELRWLTPVLLIGALYLFWIWIYWTNPQPFDYVFDTSSYRVVDATILLASLAIPISAERLLLAERRP